MRIDFRKYLAKYPVFKNHIFADQIEMHQIYYWYQIKATLTREGEFTMLSLDTMPANHPSSWKILVDKQYFKEEQLDKDLEMFLCKWTN